MAFEFVASSVTHNAQADRATKARQRRRLRWL